MKTLIVLATFAIGNGGFKYACADEHNKAVRMMSNEIFEVGDTVIVDSLFYIVDIKPRR